VEQQAALMLAGTRDCLIRQRTQLSNAMRGYAAEFGIITSKGLCKIEPLLARIASVPEEKVPTLAKDMFAVFAGEFEQVQAELGKVERLLKEWYKSNETSRRLVEVDGIGPIGASLAVMKTPDPHAFSCGRNYSAWIGLTPKDHSTAGKKRLGGITRAGDETLRAVLIAGATAVINQVRRGTAKHSPWLADLVRRKPPKLAAVALASKNARIAWKLMVSGERYDRSRCGRRHRPEPAAAPTACMVTACSPPSRPLRAASGGGLRPALTAAARAVTAQSQVGTKKRLSGRTKKLNRRLQQITTSVAR
jgi:transposase